MLQKMTSPGTPISGHNLQVIHPCAPRTSLDFASLPLDMALIVSFMKLLLSVIEVLQETNQTMQMLHLGGSQFSHGAPMRTPYPRLDSPVPGYSRWSILEWETGSPA